MPISEEIVAHVRRSFASITTHLTVSHMQNTFDVPDEEGVIEEFHNHYAHANMVAALYMGAKPYTDTIIEEGGTPLPPHDQEVAMMIDRHLKEMVDEYLMITTRRPEAMKGNNCADEEL